MGKPPEARRRRRREPEGMRSQPAPGGPRRGRSAGPGPPAVRPEPQRGPSRRAVLALLTVATAVGSLGLAAGGTAGGLLATEMTGSVAAAGLPLGVLVAGSAAGALVISNRAGRAGRGAGLILGYVI